MSQPITRYEYWNTFDTLNSNIYGANWVSQVFTCSDIVHSITSLQLKLHKYGSPATITVSIQAVNSVTGKPDGTDLTTVVVDATGFTTVVTGAWETITFSTIITLLANATYAIVVRCPSGNGTNYVIWREAAFTYDGPIAASTDSGSTWTLDLTKVMLFEIWGSSALSPQNKQSNQMFSTTALGYWSTEAQVYSVTGMSSGVVQKMMGAGKVAADATALINSYIQISDQRIRHLMGLPYTIRKEYHVFHFNEQFKEFGPAEDEYEFFDYYDPMDRVEKVFAIYSNKRRMKYTFPKDCDALTEDTVVISSETAIDGMEWTTDDVPTSPTPTTLIRQDTSDFVAGTASLECQVTNSTGGMIVFPRTKNLQKAQYPYDYLAFWMKTNDPDAVFTFKMYDVLGRSVSQTFYCGNSDFNKTLSFNPAIADTWQIVALKFMMMTGYAGGVNWVFVPVQYFTIEVDRPCVFHIDNLNWNDGIFFTKPKGLLCWSRSEISPINDELEVTYSFDPFKQEVPVDISIGSAKMAGIMLLEYLIGIRQRSTAFTQSSDALTVSPDRETLEFTKARLEREVESFIAGIGFKTYSGVGAEG